MNKEIEDRVAKLREFFSDEFLPGAYTGGPMRDAQERQANALEYMAHQAGKIREDLSAIREYLKTMAGSV